jgi:hypothetical protein
MECRSLCLAIIMVGAILNLKMAVMCVLVSLEWVVGYRRGTCGHAVISASLYYPFEC